MQKLTAIPCFDITPAGPDTQEKAIHLSNHGGQPQRERWALHPRTQREHRATTVPRLSDVPETMLWALHNRASEATRRDGVLADPDSVHIHQAIDYDFTRRFGEPSGSLAARAARIDEALRSWLERHPDGCVISLGEGLETQSRRVDNGRMHWLSVDLPDAIRFRDRFLVPTPRFRHIAASALDPVWMDAVEPRSDVFIVVQGLLMYLEPEAVRRLLTGIVDRFPDAEIVFDAVPRWFSDLTLRGLNLTPHYRLPAMPWGINRNEIESTLRSWHPHVGTVEFLDYRSPRGLPRILADMTSQMPIFRHRVPSLVHVRLANVARRSGAPQTPPAERPFRRSRHDAHGLHPHDLTTSRKSLMNDTISHPSTVDGIFAMARQNADHRDSMATATTRIIARRVALGVSAALDPLHADHTEFARMVPEKVEAFSDAGRVMLTQSDQASRHMLGLALAEVLSTARATVEMTSCSSPAVLARAQSKFAYAWFDRVAANWIALGMQTLNAQAAVMAPIRLTVDANSERLYRPQL